MKKLETNQLAGLLLYNELVDTLDKMRADKASSHELIEGYELAREMVGYFFQDNIIDEDRFYSLDSYLHCCSDCPLTHTVPLSALHLDWTLYLT